MAHAMMWVKLTLGVLVAARWRFTRARFSSRARTGTSRIEVAVGTESDASMFSMTRTIPPRTGSTTSPGRMRGARARDRGASAVPVEPDAAGAVVAIGAGWCARAGASISLVKVWRSTIFVSLVVTLMGSTIVGSIATGAGEIASTAGSSTDGPSVASVTVTGWRRNVAVSVPPSGSGRLST